LMLLSPLLRSLLAELPCTSRLEPTLSLPDVTAQTLLNLQDLLSRGHCQLPLSLAQTADLLDLCQLLGVDIRKLHVGRQERAGLPVREVTVNIDSVRTKGEDIKAIIQQSRKEGNQIILTKSFKKAPSFVSKPPTNPNKDLPPQAAIVAVKKEKVSPVDEVQSKEDGEERMDTEQSSQPNTTPSVTLTTTPTPPSPPPARREKFACEKCKKVQETALLLKYHYCSHYMDILRKKFDNNEDSKKNICFICKKAHPNSRRLLLHIGVNHDKINDILKVKGFKQITSTTGKAAETKKVEDKEVSREDTEVNKKVMSGEADAEKKLSREEAVADKKVLSGETLADKKSFDIRSMMDLNTAPAAPPGPSMNSEEKKSLDSECNFNLECQVCRQKLGSFHQLEQHCCRHFMKELAEQFSAITEDMKCGMCNSAFKQKHSLLLHIGCKHGKINEILKQKGYVVLPAPIVNKGNGALQKQMQSRLLEIKKERREDDDNLKTEALDSPGEGDGQHEETLGPYAFKLSEVLNKFSVPSI